MEYYLIQIMHQMILFHHETGPHILSAFVILTHPSNTRHSYFKYDKVPTVARTIPEILILLFRPISSSASCSLTD
jgi:hypothetical protein